MKRKSHNHVPDFSSKRAVPPVAQGAQGEHVAKPKQPPAPVAHGGKPHSTSKKSGRRGG